MSNWRKAPATLGQLLIVTLLGVPLITPLLRWTAVPCTHDGHLHVHRVAAMRHAWENGVYFSRWLPDLALGYGYPFFVYREPTPLYAVLLPHLLGLSLPAASNLFYAFCILAAGWFMFLWVRDVSGSRAGLVSAVAYMAAPYILIDAFVRGNAPESLALPLLPFLLWIGRRWMMQGSAKTFLVSVFSLAFLSLSHNISLFIFTPLFFVYLIIIGRLHKLSWRPVATRLLLLFGLGLGMTLFYTGGALLEMDEVTLSQSTTTRNNDFHFNFASWAEILSPPAAEDPELINPPLPIRLGWIPVALALLGVSTLIWKTIRREQRWHIYIMVAVAALFLFMSLEISLPLWENIPLIDFVQFPWRFIGRAALPVAFLAGAPFAQQIETKASASSRRKRVWSQVALLAAIALLILEALPNLYPRTCKENSFPTIVDVHAYEQATGLVGIDPEGSYFPRTVEERPRESPLTADYAAGRTPQRFDQSLLPAGAEATAVYEPLAASIQIDTPTPFTARYLSFAFPGWSVFVDGQQVPAIPGDPHGLITFTVPAGQHEITIQWQSTLLRTALSLVSILAFLGVVATAVLLLRRSPASIPAATSEADEGIPTVPLILLAVALLLFKVLLIDDMQSPWRSSSPPPVDVPMSLTAGELDFEGYSLSETNVAAGDTFDIDLAWRKIAPSEERYQSNVWLADAGGLLWSDKDTHRPRLYEDAPPTREWGVGQWAWDSREVAVYPGTPPGQYDIVMTLFDFNTQQPLTLRDAQGGVVGPTAVIGQMMVQAPQEAAPQEAAPVQPQFSSGEMVPGTGMTLIGYNMGLEALAPGEELLITLFWQRGEEPAAGSYEMQLRSAAGDVLQTWQLPLARSDFDTAAWLPGQPLRSQHLLRLEAGLESGSYQFTLQDAVDLGLVEVIAPERVYAEPEMDTAVDKLFGDQIKLIGYSFLAEPLGIELVWSAAEAIDDNYHVFVHLVDEQGAIITQSDGQPANWTRPTTGWVPGEIIVDSHALPVPPDLLPEAVHLRVGIYDPDSGERLLVDDSDFLSLPLRD